MSANNSTTPPTNPPGMCRRTLQILALFIPILVLAADQSRLTAITAQYFEPELLLKSEQYHRFRLQLFGLQSVILLTVLFCLVHGPLGRWSRLALGLTKGRLWLARMLILSTVYTALACIRLPFSIVRYFHAQSYQLRHDALATYLLDWIKGYLILGFLVLLVGLIILGIFAAFPRWWAILATAATGLLALAYTVLAPLIVDPLYNDFTPLMEPELKQRLIDLTRCAGLQIDEVLVADASRRSASVNAYVTGIGGSQRIVIYDTLVDHFTVAEVANVVAHESAHWTGQHVLKGLILGILALFIGLLSSDWVLSRLVARRFRGIDSRQDPALAVPGYAIYVLAMYIALVPSNIVSRNLEREADQRALELTRDPDTFIRTSVRIARSNLANIAPPNWVEFAFFTHPSISRRIMMAEDFRNHPKMNQNACVAGD